MQLGRRSIQPTLTSLDNSAPRSTRAAQSASSCQTAICRVEWPSTGSPTKSRAMRRWSSLSHKSTKRKSSVPLDHFRQSLEAIIESSAEALICAGCLLYPDLVEQLLRKVAKQQMTSQSKKSYFKENQAKTWSEILAHPLFADVDEDLYSFEWVSENDDCEYQ
jgi:hypothetical protein